MLITIDLTNADSVARATFDREMATRHWTKAPTVTTTWTAVFTDQTTSPAAIAIAKTNVALCARAARITRYSAVCLPSNEAVFDFQVAS